MKKKGVILFVGLLALASVVPAWASEGRVKKSYYVTGMMCSGCVNSITGALKKAGFQEDQIEVNLKHSNVKVKAGEAILSMTQAQAGEAGMDCKVVHAIESAGNYNAYMNPKNPTPCPTKKN